MRPNDSNESTWYNATAVARPARERLAIDLDVDACVVGGGLAGLTAALELARKGRSVALLEARRVAWNASGRNVGFVLPGFSAPASAMVERVGIEHAQKLWALSQEGVEYVRRTIAETGMPDVAVGEGWLQVSKIDREPAMRDEAALQRDDLGADVEVWPTELVRSKLKSKRYFQAIHYPAAFHIHPLNYALGLAAAAEQAGVRIFEDTPAMAIDPAGIRKRIVTPSARVRAAHVVLAGNVHLGGLVPALSRTLLSISTYVMTTQPLGERLLDAIEYQGAVSDSEWADNHYRVTPDGRLMWSGRLTMWSGNPKRYARGLRRDLLRTFPQLGHAQISHSWTGVLGRPVHGMPQIGELSPGVWLASGFSGHGLNTTAMAGELIARAIVDGDMTWRLFAPYELIWAGGIAGRAALQSGYWAARITDAVKARRSRNAEFKRKRAAQAVVEQITEEVQREADEAVEATAEKAAAEAERAMEAAEAAEAERRPA